MDANFNMIKTPMAAMFIFSLTKFVVFSQKNWDLLGKNSV